jgi:GT2 family glycosyltransferase
VERQIEIVVIDNSPTRDLEPLCLELGANYIFTGRNIGFGAGHNIAFNQSSRAPYHLVLNPDVQFGAEVLLELLQFMDINQSVGLVMPKIVYPDGSSQNLCKKLPTPFDIIARRLFPAPIQRLIKDRMDTFELQDMDLNRILSVPYLSGCCMLLRREAIERVCGFDQRFFMYFEDLDLTRRIHKHYRTVYYPGVCVVHRHEKGSYKDLRLLYCGLESAVRYFNKWGWINDRERNQINASIGPALTLSSPRASKD